MRAADPPIGVPRWHQMDAGAAADTLGVTLSGLTSQDAVSRLQGFGPNTIALRRRARPLLILLRQFKSPLVYVLLAALVVTVAIGEWKDGIAIALVVTINTLVGFFQEFRAENAVRALMSLAAPRAVVVRDGVQRELGSAEVVPGDLAVLSAGARVPADMRLISATRLRIDESMLTGESVPSDKSVELVPGRAEVPVADRFNMAFSGTTVAAGRGTGLVVATGRRTELGAIASMLEREKPDSLPRERRISSLARMIAIAVAVASLVVFALGVSVGRSPAQMFLTAVALAVSAIPEGLPAAVTIALAVGVRRMARRKALVRQLAAVETLGSCTVVLADKTGTLTENRMTVARIVAGGVDYEVSGGGDRAEGQFVPGDRAGDARDRSALEAVLTTGAMCAEAVIRIEDGGVHASGDPTEVALLVSAAKAGLVAGLLLAENPRTGAIPFDPAEAYSASIHQGRGGAPTVYLMGAPERVLEMCDRQLGRDGLEPLDRGAVDGAAARLADRGLRVLAMAVGYGVETAGSAEGATPAGLVFVGLQGMQDPPRAEVPAAIEACRRAGIRVVMVTGDHAATAAAIASQIGLDRGGGRPRVILGSELARMDDREFLAAIRTVDVFARVSPEQKLRIVEVLKGEGEVVAVTGDGVNDAPALRTAHLGTAMGRRGTDVAREASAIVLTDDNFATVHAAVEEGRTAFANIRNVSYFLLVTAVGEVLTILASLALRMPLPLLPVQLLWLNVVTEGTQTVALAAERGEPRLFTLPPRRRLEGILSRPLTERVLLVGAVQGVAALSVFAWQQDVGLDYARSAVLTVMVLTQVFLVGSSRSETANVLAKSPLSNPWLFWGVALALGLHVAVMYTSWGQELFHLAPLEAGMWLRLAAIAGSVLVTAEVHKLVRRERIPRETGAVG